MFEDRFFTGLCDPDSLRHGDERIHQFRDGKIFCENYTLQIDDNGNIIGYCNNEKDESVRRTGRRKEHKWQLQLKH